MYKLDLKDKKILSILEKDSRISLTKIAKNVGLSRDGVKYRINNYEKDGLIKGYRTQIDLTKLGYKANHLFIKLSNPAIDIEKEIIKELNNLDYVRAIIRFNDNYDLQVAFVSKDIEDLDDKITEIITICKNYIQDYEIMTISKYFVSRTFPKSFLDNRDIIENNSSKIKLDLKDIEILKILGDNAQEALFEIGDKLKISPDAVAYRIKNMIKSGIILRFIPDIDHTILGYGWYVLLLNIPGLDIKKEKKLKEFLLNDKNTVWAVKTIGRFNTMVYFYTTEIGMLQESLIKLRSLFPNEINNHITLIARERSKFTYFPKELSVNTKYFKVIL